VNKKKPKPSEKGPNTEKEITFTKMDFFFFLFWALHRQRKKDGHKKVWVQGRGWQEKKGKNW